MLDYKKSLNMGLSNCLSLVIIKSRQVTALYSAPNKFKKNIDENQYK